MHLLQCKTRKTNKFGSIRGTLDDLDDKLIIETETYRKNVFTNLNNGKYPNSYINNNMPKQSK